MLVRPVLLMKFTALYGSTAFIEKISLRAPLLLVRNGGVDNDALRCGLPNYGASWRACLEYNNVGSRHAVFEISAACLA